MVFELKSGELKVTREHERLILDFPARRARKISAPPKELAAGLGAEPITVLGGRDYVAIFEFEEEIAGIRPDFDVIARLGAQGVVVTAPRRL